MSSPSLPAQAGRLVASLAAWAKQGFPATTEKVLRQRIAICNACEHWSPRAFGGLGRCLKCGCSAAKLAIATSNCPVNLWGKETGKNG